MYWFIWEVYCSLRRENFVYFKDLYCTNLVVIFCWPSVLLYADKLLNDFLVILYYPTSDLDVSAIGLCQTVYYNYVIHKNLQTFSTAFLATMSLNSEHESKWASIMSVVPHSEQVGASTKRILWRCFCRKIMYVSNTVSCNTN